MTQLPTLDEAHQIRQKLERINREIGVLQRDKDYYEKVLRDMNRVERWGK